MRERTKVSVAFELTNSRRPPYTRNWPAKW